MALAGLAFVAAAAAATGEPKKVIIPAVQAKAKAINVQRSDLPGTGWKPHVTSSSDETPRC